MSKRDTAGKVVELKQQTKLLFFSLFLHLIIKKIQYNNLKNKKPVKKFLLSLCFLLALSPAARSSIYLFEQFDDTFLLNGWSVVGTDPVRNAQPSLCAGAAYPDQRRQHVHRPMERTCGKCPDKSRCHRQFDMER